MMEYIWKYMRKDQKGFTLVELLVVVVILGILATLAVQSLGDKRRDAEISRAKADIRSVMSALEVQRLESAAGTYPAATGTPAAPTGLVGTYIRSWPTHLTYAVSGTTYTLTSTITNKSSAAITDSNLNTP